MNELKYKQLINLITLFKNYYNISFEIFSKIKCYTIIKIKENL